jgi:hypothetical protein
MRDSEVYVRHPDGRMIRPCCVCRHSAAVACRECVRALALFGENSGGEWWSCINRHPDHGNDCKMCHQGLAAYCGTCLLIEALSHRHLVRGPLRDVIERGYAVPRTPVEGASDGR